MGAFAGGGDHLQSPVAQMSGGKFADVKLLLWRRDVDRRRNA
jgi:hypothetical protein